MVGAVMFVENQMESCLRGEIVVHASMYDKDPKHLQDLHLTVSTAHVCDQLFLIQCLLRDLQR